MKVVILHHHLRDGEVTQIIQDQIGALQNNEITDITLLVGSNPNDLEISGVTIAVLDELNYLDTSTIEEHNYNSTASKILEFLERYIDKETILHVHNCNLGRNPLLTYSIYQLAWRGIYVVNHCHDFAEDHPKDKAVLEKMLHGHFKLGLKQVLYPTLKNYSFAVQSNHNKKRLKLYGVPNDKITVLPNPVNKIETIDDIDDHARQEICCNLDIPDNKMIMTYPLKTLPQNNIGEFILLSVLFKEEASWLITSLPRIPIETDDYHLWKNFTEEHNLDIQWEADKDCSFASIMRGTDCCVTPSARQGYGKVYLEPWLYSKPIVGREHSTVVNDLRASGLSFPFLYSKLKVCHFNMECDFKELETHSQMEIIDQILTSDEARKKVFSMNPDIVQITQMPPQTLINSNKELIEDIFSCHKYGEKLHQVYAELVG